MSAFGREYFVKHYGMQIGDEDIFAYVYALLHSPVYRLKYYGDGIIHDFPPIELKKDFSFWRDRGERLLDLHVNYESVEPHPNVILKRERDYPVLVPRPRRDKKRTDGIILDEKDALYGIPEEAWGYVVGNHSALEWVLNQSKAVRWKKAGGSNRGDDGRRERGEIPPKETYEDYKEWSERKEELIDLIKRVCSVSTETVRIQKEIQHEEQKEAA